VSGTPVTSDLFRLARLLIPTVRPSGGFSERKRGDKEQEHNDPIARRCLHSAHRTSSRKSPKCFVEGFEFVKHTTRVSGQSDHVGNIPRSRKPGEGWFFRPGAAAERLL